MATPSVSLIESLIGAIPIEVGAALVARVGERATITAKSGSIEVGSVALTVEAMDDLIAQVLPPDQLESLQENGTVHFEFKPQVIGGDFAVLAASTPGDRWLEIRRRTTAVGTTAVPAVAQPAATAPAAVPAVEPEVVTPVPTAAQSARPRAEETDVAKLLSRFQVSPEAEPVSWEPPPAVQEAPLPPPLSDFDLNLMGTVPAKESSPVPRATAVQQISTNDDLAIPSILDFPGAKSDFDLDDLSLPDTLPGPAVESFTAEASSESADSDHFSTLESKARGMGKFQFPTSTAEGQPRRSIVVIASVVLGLVVLGAGGWYAAQYYLSTPSTVATAPAPRTPAPSNGAAANATANTLKAGSAKASPSVAGQKPHSDVSAPTPMPPQPIARARAEITTPKPATAPAAAPVNAPVVRQDIAPAPPAARDGFAIQVAAVLERSEADRIVARLVNEGYPGYAIRGQGSAAAYFRVRVGAFKDRQTAEDVAARLERSEGIKPWIVKETP
jgi:cell division septation protein DedD